MSSHCNPDIVEDGLVLLYDVDDIQSYKGEPTTNLVGNMTKRFNNWNDLTGTSEYYTTSEGNQGVKVVTTSGGGVQWYTNSTIYNIQASTQYTISATIKYFGGTPHPNTLYVRQYDGDGQTSESGKFTTANQKDLGGGWKRIWRTFTTDSTTTHINLQGYQYYSDRTIYIQDLQFELKSHNTQFAGASTTRSATQGLLDRTGNTTIDISNASFDSNAQMTFDGTDDDIDAGIGTSTSFQRTIEMVFKTNSLASYTPLACYTRGGGQSVVSGKRMWLGFQSNKFQMHGWGTNDPASTTTIQTGKYYHAVYAYDQTTKKHYIWINGVLENNTTNDQSGFTGWNSSGDHKWFVGGDPDSASWFASAGRSLNGEIPIFKVYDRILSNAEVLRNYKSTKSRFNL